MRVKCNSQTLGLALVLVIGVVLVCGDAHASTTGFGLGGGLGGGLDDPFGGGALNLLIEKLKKNIADVASIAVLGIGMFLAFAKSGWMELVGSLAFIATLGIAVSWAAGQTTTFFASGAIL